MLQVSMALWLCSAGTISVVHFWHQASGMRHQVLSPDAATVQLTKVPEEFHLDPGTLKLKSGTSDFVAMGNPGPLSLDVLRELCPGKGSEAHPFVVDGAPEAGEGN